jgi:hypothetical protein
VDKTFPRAGRIHVGMVQLIVWITIEISTAVVAGDGTLIVRVVNSASEDVYRILLVTIRRPYVFIH